MYEVTEIRWDQAWNQILDLPNSYHWDTGPTAEATKSHFIVCIYLFKVVAIAISEPPTPWMTPKECPLTLSAHGFHKGGECAVHVSDNSDGVDEVWGECACLMSQEKNFVWGRNPTHHECLGRIVNTVCTFVIRGQVCCSYFWWQHLVFMRCEVCLSSWPKLKRKHWITR